MNFVEAVVHNPVKVSVAVILILLFGALALYGLPMQLTPEVEVPEVTVETRWTGASPQEVEREIILEQEKQLKSVEGVTKMSSESMDGMGRITMEFAVGTNMSDAILKVNTRLQQVREYPEDADEPTIRTSSLANRPIAWFILGPRRVSDDDMKKFAAEHPELAPRLARVLSASSEGVATFRLREIVREYPEAAVLLPTDVDVTKLRKFAEDVIEARFERVEGVSDSTVMGGREVEMQVIVDPQKLAARQLTVYDVRNALRGQNHDVSGGDLWEGKRRYVVRTLAQYRDEKQIGDTLIAVREGQPVYVRDVCAVEIGYKKPDGLVNRFGSQRLAINAQREVGANVLQVMDGLRQACAELNAGELKQRGLTLAQVYDESDYIYSAMDLVTENLLTGAILTFITLLVFLKDTRSTAIIFLHIVTSTVGAFLAMALFGRSLNVLALGGLAFAVGMLVDNAIVMLENIHRKHQLGQDPVTASVTGAKEVWAALFNATLANLAVFLPVLFIKEEAGQLFSDIALVICAAVALSMLVAITVVPTAARRLLHDHDDQDKPPPDDAHANGAATSTSHILNTNGHVAANGRHSRVGAIYGAGRRAWTSFLDVVLKPLDKLGAAFVNLVLGINGWLAHGVLRRLAIIMVFVGGSLLFSWLLFPKVEYLPNGNRNLVIAILLPPPGYNMDQMLGMGSDIETKLRPYWDVDAGSPEEAALEYPRIVDYFFVVRGRQIFMGLRSADPDRAAELVPLMRQVAGGIPGTIVVAKQTSLFERGLTSGRTVDIEITGPDLAKLVGLGGRIIGQVQQVVPNSQTIPIPSLDLSSPELHVRPRNEQLTELGMTAEELGYTVDALVDGAYVTDYYIGGDKIDLRIVGQEAQAKRTQDIENLTIATRTGDLVPLRALATVSLSGGPEQINRRERQRAITIQVSPPREIALEDAMQRIQAEIVQPLIDDGTLEQGNYQINLEGTADKLRSTWQALRWNILLAILITYLFMAATFESWIYPFVVMLTVPLGAVGGIAALWFLNLFTFQALDVLTMLGFVMLVGTVVNNPILIVEQALVHIREDGMSTRAAIHESVRTRIRPIFMTTLGGLVGLLPLVIAPGPGSELYRGLGAVLLGGLLVSTFITLILVPALFSLALEVRERLLGTQGVTQAALQPEPPARQASETMTAS